MKSVSITCFSCRFVQMFHFPSVEESEKNWTRLFLAAIIVIRLFLCS